jgi:hypothetical protein
VEGKMEIVSLCIVAALSSALIVSEKKYVRIGERAKYVPKVISSVYNAHDYDAFVVDSIQKLLKCTNAVAIQVKNYVESGFSRTHIYCHKDIWMSEERFEFIEGLIKNGRRKV